MMKLILILAAAAVALGAPAGAPDVPGFLVLDKDAIEDMISVHTYKLSPAPLSPTLGIRTLMEKRSVLKKRDLSNNISWLDILNNNISCHGCGVHSIVSAIRPSNQ